MNTGRVQVVHAGADAAWLKAEAARRRTTPLVLAKGIVAMVRMGGLLDAVFDGADPHGAAGGHARHGNGLTHLQCAVLHLVAVHRDAAGVCRLSAPRIAALINAGTTANCSISGAQGALSTLVARGCLRKAAKEFSGGVQPHRLTAVGARLARELGGEGD